MREMRVEMAPRVSFVVPCYKLAHLLPDCVNSILRQSFQDLEILVMDDCSPDDTAQVARGFGDRRVVHVRNDENLGHLANYNKGIGLAKGEFIWLISADDCLRGAHALESYVNVLDSHPSVGFAFCPAMALIDGQEKGLVPWGTNGEQDFVVRGREYLETLLRGNRVVAPSAIVRRCCYDIERFPLDMPYAGDWYLWCRFALEFDVAYVAEPMVYYRLHQTNMTEAFTGEDSRKGIEDESRVLWRIHDDARRAGLEEISELARESLTATYVRMLRMTEDQAPGGLTIQEVYGLVDAHAGDDGLNRKVRGSVLGGLGDHCYWDGDRGRAEDLYRSALTEYPWSVALRLKRFLLQLGGLGATVRRALSAAAGAGRKA